MTLPWHGEEPHGSASFGHSPPENRKDHCLENLVSKYLILEYVNQFDLAAKFIHCRRKS